ncbi:MAG: hypothetical protein EOO09_18940 [Chitinophagaceae bacterium]|nr:MAG: hypothetical protein EOO09_18940 [Chitinophagaceae bacterium]
MSTLEFLTALHPLDTYSVEEQLWLQRHYMWAEVISSRSAGWPVSMTRNYSASGWRPGIFNASIEPSEIMGTLHETTVVERFQLQQNNNLSEWQGMN